MKRVFAVIVSFVSVGLMAAGIAAAAAQARWVWVGPNGTPEYLWAAGALIWTGEVAGTWRSA